MVEGPFTVVWESCDQDEWNDPAAEWERHEKAYSTEREAVHAWENAKMFVNTRPVSIDPEPDWSNYTYDGKTPLRKWST